MLVGRAIRLQVDLHPRNTGVLKSLQRFPGQLRRQFDEREIRPYRDVAEVAAVQTAFVGDGTDNVRRGPLCAACPPRCGRSPALHAVCDPVGPCLAGGRRDRVAAASPAAARSSGTLRRRATGRPARRRYRPSARRFRARSPRMSLRNRSIPGASSASVIESRNFATRWALTSSTVGRSAGIDELLIGRPSRST